MSAENYVFNMPFINWDKNQLIDIMKSYPKTSWKNEGYQNNYLRPEMHTAFQELYDQLPEFEINIGRTFFAELTPETILHPHIDLYRSASINFPLMGDFTKSPVRFHREKSFKKEHLLYEHLYDTTCPTIINTTVFHSAVNPTKEIRYLFSLSVYADWNTISSVIKKKL